MNSWSCSSCKVQFDYVSPDSRIKNLERQWHRKSCTTAEAERKARENQSNEALSQGLQDCCSSLKSKENDNTVTCRTDKSASDEYDYDTRRECNIFELVRQFKQSRSNPESLLIDFQKKLLNRYRSLASLKMQSKNSLKPDPYHILSLHSARQETHLSIEQGNVWLRVIRNLFSDTLGSHTVSAIPVDFKTISGYIDKDILGTGDRDLYKLKSLEWGFNELDER